MTIRKLFIAKDGAIGIGSLIIFIAMMLIAGIVASTVIQIMNNLQQQALETSTETIKDIASGIEVTQITGKTNGNTGVEYNYNVVSTHPDGEDVYYYIEWGDGTIQNWSGPYPSSQVTTFKHTFNQKDTYVIRAKARDENNIESLWGNLMVTMPRYAQGHHTGIFYFLYQIIELLYKI